MDSCFGNFQQLKYSQRVTLPNSKIDIIPYCAGTCLPFATPLFNYKFMLLVILLDDMALLSQRYYHHLLGHMVGGTVWRIIHETDDIVYMVDYNHRYRYPTLFLLLFGLNNTGFCF